jgi:hypothetical protein
MAIINLNNPTDPTDNTVVVAEANVTDEEKQLQEFCNTLTEEFSAQSGIKVGIEFDGNSTRVKMQRIPGGYKVNVGLKAFVQSKADFLARLKHEFAHIQNDNEYILDTCGNGAYHTDKFKDAVEALGCKVEWTKSYGFAGSVALNDEEKAKLTDPDKFILEKDSVVFNKPKPPKEPKVKEPKEPKEKQPRKSTAKIVKIFNEELQRFFFVQGNAAFTTEEAFEAQEAKAAAKASVLKEDPTDAVAEEVVEDDLLA